METDILPLTSRLVAGPDARIALRAGPAVEGDDEGTRIGSVVRHNLRHVGHTVQTKGIARTDPCHVRLENAHASIAHLLDDVTLQECLHTLLGVQVALCPESYLDTLAACILPELAEVLHVAIERLRLSVASPVTIVGQKPPQGHVVVQVAVYGGPC